MRSRAHGHVQAVALAMQRLGLASVIASKPSRERDLVLAMVASRIVQPDTKLATTRRWHCSTLAEDFGVADATEDDLYAAMDWLLARQDAIEQKLAARHLREDALVLYDLSSSYFEGSTCPLAKRGYSRDGRPGTLQVNYGLLTDARGCPVAVSVFEGNTSDSLTFLPAVQRVRERFGLAQVVMVGDRGMVSQKAIDELRGQGGIDWITALKSVSIRSLVEHGHLQLGLFDQRNLAEITSPDYPGERLVACRNDALAKLRAHKRESLLQATEALLALVKASVDAGRLTGQDKIGVQVGKIINRHKVAKHFELSIGEATLAWSRQARRHRCRGGAGRAVRHSHLAGRQAHGCTQLRAQLQGLVQCGAGVPLIEDGGPEGAAHPPPVGRPGARAHPAVHAGVLRRVAHA